MLIDLKYLELRDKFYKFYENIYTFFGNTEDEELEDNVGDEVDLIGLWKFIRTLFEKNNK
jgi:hypothetical protein